MTDEPCAIVVILERCEPMFDGADFPRPPPRRRHVNETMVTIGIVLFAMIMLFMPISLAGLVDLVRYFRGH